MPLKEDEGSDEGFALVIGSSQGYRESIASLLERYLKSSTHSWTEFKKWTGIKDLSTYCGSIYPKKNKEDPDGLREKRRRLTGITLSTLGYGAVVSEPDRPSETASESVGRTDPRH